ncbi:MAG: hypothetical protein IIU35_01410 [Neisseriaceae bacterium]|nr:hypothetical protein [Neisseriaceae bacterium]
MSDNKVTPPPLPKKNKTTPPPIPTQNNAAQSETPPQTVEQGEPALQIETKPQAEQVVLEQPTKPTSQAEPKPQAEQAVEQPKPAPQAEPKPQAEQVVVEQSKPEPQAVLSPQEKEKTKKPIGLIIGIIVLLLMILGVGVIAAKMLPKFFRLMNSGQVQSEQQVTQETLPEKINTEETATRTETETATTPDSTVQVGKVPFTTTVILNLRQCADIQCKSVGIIPKSATVYPILNADGKTNYKADTDTTGWINFHYQGKLCHPDDFNKDKGECLAWQDNQTADGWLHSSGVVFNININELVNSNHARPLAVMKDTNIRQCASTSCDVLGVMPKETPMNILFVDNETPASWNNWFAVEYQGNFCYPTDFNQQTGCTKWTEKQKVRGFVHRSTINFDYQPPAPQEEKQVENQPSNNPLNNLF